MKRVGPLVVAAIVLGAPAAALAHPSHGGGGGSFGGGGGGGGHSSGGGGGGGGGHSSGGGGGWGGGSSSHSTGGGSSGGGWHGGGSSGGGYHGGGGGTTTDHRGPIGGGGTTTDHRGPIGPVGPGGGHGGGDHGGGWHGGGYHGGYYGPGGVWIDGGSSTYYDDSGYYGCSDEGCGDGHYDDGSMPTWTWEIGGLARSFRGPAFTRMGTISASDGADHAYELTSGAPAPGDTSAMAADLRATLALGPHLYLGGEVELGGLMHSPLILQSDGGVARIASTTMLGGAIVAGVRARTGAFEVDGELAGGVRSFSTTISSDVVDGGDGAPVETIATPLAEARVRGRLWIAPRWFFGAQLGGGLFDRSDVDFAFVLGSSSRPYGDPYAPPPM